MSRRYFFNLGGLLSISLSLVSPRDVPKMRGSAADSHCGHCGDLIQHLSAESDHRGEISWSGEIDHKGISAH